jgi:hypothetical protein
MYELAFGMETSLQLTIPEVSEATENEFIATVQLPGGIFTSITFDNGPSKVFPSTLFLTANFTIDDATKPLTVADVKE